MSHTSHQHQQRRQHTNGVDHAHDLHDVSDPRHLHDVSNTQHMGAQDHARDTSHAEDASDASQAHEAPPQQAENEKASSSSAVEQYLRTLMTRAEGELKEHPIRTLGIAAGVGVGVGALMASRILRMVVITAGSYAAKELLRDRVKAFISSKL